MAVSFWQLLEMSPIARWSICAHSPPMRFRWKPVLRKGVPSHQSPRLSGHSQMHQKASQAQNCSLIPRHLWSYLGNPPPTPMAWWRTSQSREDSRGRRKLLPSWLSQEIIPCGTLTRQLLSARGQTTNTGCWWALEMEVRTAVPGSEWPRDPPALLGYSHPRCACWDPMQPR